MIKACLLPILGFCGEKLPKACTRTLNGNGLKRPNPGIKGFGRLLLWAIFFLIVVKMNSFLITQYLLPNLLEIRMPYSITFSIKQFCLSSVILKLTYPMLMAPRSSFA